ncbi:MAG: DNA polymerase III subunit alpha [Spirochaetales bacterium]|nr:DNA polymerase III subunit alpha [Spirochaetales bacterium]
MQEFVHLHNHSDYSLLDGAMSIKKMVGKARKLGMKHVALTDHGNMFGTIKFYKECLVQEINPIIGSEFYVAPANRMEKTGKEGMNKYYHLILLAKNETGYRNLLKLSSIGFTEGFYYKPRIDEEVLKIHSSGLIALTACLAGEIPVLILQEQMEKAREKAVYYSELFGRDSFYLEFQSHGIANQKKVNEGLLKLSKQTGIPIVATNDVHYLNKDDAIAQDVIICIGTNKKLADDNRLKFGQSEFYFKTQEEMEKVFGHYPESLRNSVKIADMCRVEIPLPGAQLPQYVIPQGFTISSYFRKLVEEGMATRYPSLTEELRERMNYEISIIEKMNFIGYFLIVWDFIKFAKDSDIPVGPGRGSGAGSIVAYALRITDIDPIKYGLLFERFLNPERVSLPDFDIDFCFERREEVIKYVTEKYGKDKVGQIITFGTLKPKAAVRDVARVLDFPYAEADSIAKLIPGGPKITLSKALEAEPELAKIQEKNGKYRELIDISLKLEGLNRHASTHAAGIVIGRSTLTDFVPLYRDPKTGSISTQFTMEYLEDCGLVKMDFLGLKTLTLIKNTLKLLERKGITIDLNTIPEDDQVTFRMLSEGRSSCIFQFESSGMQNILKRAKPERISDLIALNALYRPGPMDNIDQFIGSKFRPETIKYPLPQLEPILKETYGVIVYQEQVMEIARKIAGYTLGQADNLRRAMGKKKMEVMEKERVKFIEGAVNLGYKANDAKNIFDLLIPFAGYGFNKSHAAAYSVLAYQTAYLKANYPPEFMAANLTNEITNTDKLTEYIKETREMGIKILPPDINLSEKVFTVVDGQIMYGMLGAKNVGEAAVDEVIKQRTEEGPYQSFLDFLERVDSRVINKKVLESLIETGFFDSLGENRATLLYNLDRLSEAANDKKERKLYGQATLFENLPEEDFNTVEIERQEEYPKKMLLEWEKDYLGLYISGHPLDSYREAIEASANLDLSKLSYAAKDKEYLIIGILKGVKEIFTKKGDKMAFAACEDFNGSIELVIFSDAFNKYREMIFNENIVILSGKIDSKKGDAKLIVNTMSQDLNSLKPRKTTSLHIRVTLRGNDEEELHDLRDKCMENKGDCSLFIHLDETDNGNGDYIKASSYIKVKDDESFIQELYRIPQVVDVWRD